MMIGDSTVRAMRWEMLRLLRLIGAAGGSTRSAGGSVRDMGPTLGGAPLFDNDRQKDADAVLPALRALVSLRFLRGVDLTKLELSAAEHFVRAVGKADEDVGVGVKPEHARARAAKSASDDDDVVALGKRWQRGGRARW